MSARSVRQTGRLAHVPDGWDELTEALNQRGAMTLAPTQAWPGSPIDDCQLFARLWSSSDARLRESAVVLLLVRPDLAPAAIAAADSLSGDDRERAMMAYVAASALQRMWRSRLELALGPQPLIPPTFLDRWSLPPLDKRHGELTLLALADVERAAHEYDAWSGYLSLMDGLLGKLDAAVHGA